MDRRVALSTLLGRGPQKASSAPLAINTGLAPYTGPWGYEQAAHLLRRSMFGPTAAQIKWAVEQGLDAVIDKLFEDLPQPEPPVNSYYPNDPNVPIGSTWVNAPYPAISMAEEIIYRHRSILSWGIGLMWEEGISAREKLTLFWHNHFPSNSQAEPKFLYRNNALLRSYAWGNFRELTKAVTIDPTMLIVLNGNKNSKLSPNENYARELLELFTIGKGPLAGPGDYTNYTEQDVREIARSLTGWRDFGFTVESISGEIGSTFLPQIHDTGAKTLSARFGNTVINNMGDQEYAHVVDIIFQQPEVARFICRKLYQWYIYYEIDSEIESNVIEPMAQVLLDNEFEIKPALKALLSSEHFFDTKNIGIMIKHPLDLIMSTLKPMNVQHSQALDQKYNSWFRYYDLANLMQMTFCNIPEVAGWKAYYLAPLYYRNWINATTLPLRTKLTDTLSTYGYYPSQGNGELMRIDVLALVETIDNPMDPNSLVEELSLMLLPKELSDNQKAALKGILLPGLPDFEWTVEYGEYMQNPDDSGLASAVETKLRSLLKAMLSMPEFQLS